MPIKEGQTGTAPDGTRVIVRGGRVVPLNPSAGHGGRVTGSAETRSKVSLTLQNMVEAQKRMDQMEHDGYRVGHDWLAEGLDHRDPKDWLHMDNLGRTLGGNDYQEYTGSAKTIEGALLPIFSGANVTESEAARYVSANAPQTSDTAETLALKAANRKRMINAAAQMVGQAVPFPDVEAWQPGAGDQGRGPTSDQGFNNKPRRPLAPPPRMNALASPPAPKPQPAQGGGWSIKPKGQ